MKEIWKNIEGYEGYYKISNLGKVNSLRNKKILKPYLSDGYYRVTLCVNGNRKIYKIHRLVAKSFVLNTHNKLHVNHMDGNKINNNIDNLEWCTNHENRIHAALIGLMPYGENHCNSKLTNKQVLEIRKKYIPFKYGQTKLAKEYGVHHSTIQDILNYKQWKRCV